MLEPFLELVPTAFDGVQLGELRREVSDSEKQIYCRLWSATEYP